jgi:hypothetical protein
MNRRTLTTKLFGIAAAAVPLSATVAVAASRLRCDGGRRTQWLFAYADERAIKLRGAIGID